MWNFEGHLNMLTKSNISYPYRSKRFIRLDIPKIYTYVCISHFLKIGQSYCFGKYFYFDCRDCPENLHNLDDWNYIRIPSSFRKVKLIFDEYLNRVLIYTLMIQIMIVAVYLLVIKVSSWNIFFWCFLSNVKNNKCFDSVIWQTNIS